MKVKDDFVYFTDNKDKDYILNKRYIILIDINKDTHKTRLVYEKPGNPSAHFNVTLNESFDEIMDSWGF
jgi:hypothetical protein